MGSCFMATATISNPLLDKALKFSMLSGICATQVVQSVAQNFTRTTLPCRSLVSKCLPLRSVKATSGALALALPDMVHTPRPTAMATTKAMMTTFFIGQASLLQKRREQAVLPEPLCQRGQCLADCWC